MDVRNQPALHMKFHTLVTLSIALCFASSSVSAQSIGTFPPFTKWYQNPLGVSPISLHTANGILYPAIAAAGILLFTKKNPELTKRITLFNELGVSYGYYGSHTTMTQNNTGVLYSLRKYLSVGFEATVYHAKDSTNNTLGIGGRPFFRFYPIHTERFKLYFESGAGIIFFSNEFPRPTNFLDDHRTGTHWNGTPKYGLGAEVYITPSLGINAGLRHVHISNGNHPSYERNPGHDSNGFFIGILVRP